MSFSTVSPNPDRKPAFYEKRTIKFLSLTKKHDIMPEEENFKGGLT
jgi:hypothetical protein